MFRRLLEPKLMSVQAKCVILGFTGNLTSIATENEAHLCRSGANPRGSCPELKSQRFSQFLGEFTQLM